MERMRDGDGMLDWDGDGMLVNRRGDAATMQCRRCFLLARPIRSRDLLHPRYGVGTSPDSYRWDQGHLGIFAKASTSDRAKMQNDQPRGCKTGEKWRMGENLWGPGGKWERIFGRVAFGNCHFGRVAYSKFSLKSQCKGTHSASYFMGILAQEINPKSLIPTVQVTYFA